LPTVARLDASSTRQLRCAETTSIAGTMPPIVRDPDGACRGSR
jgi:hypothetical protein